MKWDQEFDVVVTGSGGAGLTAAILAHDNGARVVVLERTDKIGGTTAVSGGAIWVPMNDHMSEVEVTDSREEALAYCKKISAGTASDEMIETFIDTAPEMVRYLEEHTPLRFTVWRTPDYYAGEPGGKPCGRSLEPEVFNKKELGDWADRLRPAPVLMVPLTLDEMFTKYRLMTGIENFPMDLVMERIQSQVVGMGGALIGGLLKGCLDRGISVLVETRARELLRENGRVAGVRAESEGTDARLRARGGVVLASGGFEWNRELVSKFIPGPLEYPNSPPFNDGDALLMATEAGADLANMTSAWWQPSGVVPGEEYEGRPLGRFISSERLAPHTILVNRFGERFVNEGIPYNDMGRVFHQFDPATHSFRNLPCWSIFDRQYRRRYPVLTVMPGDPDPEWLTRDDTLEGLAQKAGIEPTGLTAAVERWNAFVAESCDSDFRRGSGAFERAAGDPRLPMPNLGTIEEPPFYALPVYRGALGTSGGPRTNSKGQVVSVQGNVIPGLYGAGNAIASPTGIGYYSGGGTIAPAMTWGYICGINAAAEIRRN
ncbi:MAG TPA: FAD-dependent oxidoreductase [Dehalococcoidia bacterium]|nr:FAD-dependent oxidoreductase [Dehalococcoidia bacterium]